MMTYGSIEPNKIYSRRELIGLLKIGPKVFKKMVVSGELPYKTVGARYMFLGQSILDYLNGKFD